MNSRFGNPPDLQEEAVKTVLAPGPGRACVRRLGVLTRQDRHTALRDKPRFGIIRN